MRKKTIQEQYNLIKEGKGNKEIFTKQAKKEFPHIVPNSSTFSQTVDYLQHRNIISENISGVGMVSMGKSNFDWFKIFNENVDTISEETQRKTSEKVKELEEKNFNYKDFSNPDNTFSEQFLKGYYTEIKDPENEEKTVKEIKDIVSKNLSKDRLYYVKNGQFGTKNIGYTEDHPGLKKSKELKGKWKGSGYGDLKEE